MVKLERESLWLRHAFLLPTHSDPHAWGSPTRRMNSTSAAFKFTNTTPGGNFAINNPPQFTIWADLPHPGLGRGENEWYKGMGRYYSEAIDDPKQVVHFTFGVPQFSSWTSFFTNFYDRNAALLANTGRVSDTFYNLGFAGSFIVTLPFQPFIIGISGITRVYNFLTKQTPSKWYYFKPSMHAYWSSVNTIANEMAIHLGLIPRVFGTEEEQELVDPENKPEQADWVKLHEMLPELFREGGGIDVMRMATRSQRIANEAREGEIRLKQQARNLKDLKRVIAEYTAGTFHDPKPDIDTREYFLAHLKNDTSNKSDYVATESFGEFSELKQMWDFVVASQRDGSQFATFRVNHVGSMSENFSNSTRDSDIAQMLNTKVSEGRATSMNFMGGNVTAVIGEVMDKVKSALSGALDAVSLGGLSTLAGTAFVDVPKYWDSSVAQLPRAEYTIPLPNLYGNKISRFINLYIPIAMLLAAALPRSAGRSAYTSPFICQVFHQGRCQIQLGMIDSLTITRGSGNVGWNAENDMLGAEVTLSVVDLSNIMHVPIKAGFHRGNVLSTVARGVTAQAASVIGGDQAATLALAAVDGATWDEQNLFQDYMAVLTGLSVSDSYYVSNRINLNMTRSLQAFKNWKSPYNLMSSILDTTPARALSAFADYTDRF